MIKVLLDTNICIYLIKQRPSGVREHFEKHRAGEIGISTITVAELQYGVEKSTARERNAQALEAFLLPLEILPFDMLSAQAYGQIRADLERRGEPIGSMDMLIAAQALAHQYTLVTHNLREFKRVTGLSCESWVSE